MTMATLHTHTLCQLYVVVLLPLDKAVCVRPLLTFHTLFVVTFVMTLQSMHDIHAVTDI